MPCETKTLHLETECIKWTRSLQIPCAVSVNVSVREKEKVYKGMKGWWRQWCACVVGCGAFGFITHARSRKHLSRNSPTSTASFPDPSPTFWKESFAGIKAPAPSSNSVYSCFFSLSLTSSPCFPWYRAPWNLHSFQIKCEWRVCFLRIAWRDGWNPIVNMTLELTVSLGL